jgi:hypothetical protein
MGDDWSLRREKTNFKFFNLKKIKKNNLNAKRKKEKFLNLLNRLQGKMDDVALIDWSVSKGVC